MLVAFAFCPVGVVALDEVVVEAHPFVEGVGVHEVFMVCVDVEDVAVVLAYVAEDAPVMPFNERPVLPYIVSRQTRHVTVAWQRISHCRHHDVGEVLIEDGGGVFLKFGFKHCSVFLSFR